MKAGGELARESVSAVGATNKRWTRQYALVPMASWPGLDDLIWLFESDPEIKYEDLGYPASATTFTTERGGLSIRFMIAPYSYTVELQVLHGDSEVVALRMPEIVAAVDLDKAGGAEALVVTFDRNSRLNALRVQLKPRVSVTFDAQPPWAR